MVRAAFLGIFFLCCFATMRGQDSVSVQNKHWYAPDYVKVQFAGSMGIFSGGAGYAIFNNKTDLDVYAGYLPHKFSGDELFILTLKITQPLWRIKKMGDWTITPLTTGIYVTYTFGERFSTDLPEWYPSGYYWWKESLRPNIFIGGNAMYKVKNHNLFSSIGFYYDLGTNDLKLVSYAQNTHYLTVWDILHIGIGVKAVFKH
jgi:hypothetical protein